MRTDRAGCGILGGGWGMVGNGMDGAPVPGMCTPLADMLEAILKLLFGGSAGSGFRGGLGFSWSFKEQQRQTLEQEGDYCQNVI